MSLAQQAARIFRQANRRFGSPYMEVVRPLTQWALPAGFAYDANVDTIRNDAGLVLTNPEDYWTSDVVYIVPTRHDAARDAAEEFALTAGGLAYAGSLHVWIAQGDIAKVRAAHAIRVGKRWYNVDQMQEAPAGFPATDGVWAYVRLLARA